MPIKAKHNILPWHAIETLRYVSDILQISYRHFTDMLYNSYSYAAAMFQTCQVGNNSFGIVSDDNKDIDYRLICKLKFK